MTSKERNQALRDEAIARGGVISTAVNDRIFSVSDLAEYLGVSREFILSHTRGANAIPSFKVAANRLIRFRESEVLSWMESRRIRPE